LCHCRPAAWTCHGVEVDGVDMEGVFRVLHVYLDRVAHTHTHERPRHLIVEGPVAIGAARAQETDHFSGLEVQGNVLGFAITDRRTHVGGILRNVCCFKLFLLGRVANDQLPEHAGGLMTWQRTKVFEHAALCRTEYYRRRGALSHDLVGLHVEFGNGDIVDGTVIVHHVDLHDGAFRHMKVRIDLIHNGTGHADIDQLAVR